MIAQGRAAGLSRDTAQPHAESFAHHHLPALDGRFLAALLVALMYGPLAIMSVRRTAPLPCSFCEGLPGSVAADHSDLTLVADAEPIKLNWQRQEDW